MPSFKEFLGHLDELETKTYAQLFDITPFLLPDKEVIKKLIKQKNPYFTEQEIDDIVDSAEEGQAKLEEAEKKLEEEEERLEKEREEAETSANGARADANEVADDNKAEERQRKKEERKAKRAEKRAELKKLRQEQQAEMKRIYKDAVEEIKKEVKELKNKIKEAAHKLFNEFINLVQKLITGLVKTVSSLVAIIQIIALPPWNIPLALLTLLVVLEFFLDLLRQLNLVAPILRPLKNLEPFMSKENLAKVAAILDPPIVFILGLYTPFEKFKKFIEKILDKLKSLLGNPDNQKKAFKKVTKKLKKYKFKFTDIANPPTYGVDEDDQEEVQAILDTYKIGSTAAGGFWGYVDPNTIPVDKGDGVGQGVIGYKEDDEIGGDESGDASGNGAGVDAELKDTKVGAGGNSTTLELDILNNPASVSGTLDSLKTFLNSNNIINDIKSEGIASVDNYVYDVLLPSGKILNSLSEEELDELKKQFDLAFTNFEEDDNEN